MKLKDLSRSLREGPFTSFGSYPKFWATADGGVLSFEGIKENLFQVYRATRDYNTSEALRKLVEVKQWAIVGVDINWENKDFYCSDTGKKIPSAY